MEGESRGYQVAIALIIAVGSVMFFLGFHAGESRGIMRVTSIREYDMSAKVQLPKENCTSCPQDEPMAVITLSPINRDGDHIPGTITIYFTLPGENYLLIEEYDDPLVKGLRLNETKPQPVTPQGAIWMEIYGFNDLEDMSSLGISELESP